MRWPNFNVPKEQTPFLRAVRDAIENLARDLSKLAAQVDAVSKASSGTSARVSRAGITSLENRAPVVAFDQVYNDGIASTANWTPAARIELAIPSDKASMVATILSKSTGDVSSMIEVNTSAQASMDDAGYWQVRLDGLDSRNPDPYVYTPVPVVIQLFVRSETPQNANVRLSAQALFFND